MSNGWNLADDQIENAKRLLDLAKGQAYHEEEALESFALLVNGLGAPEEWADQVRAATSNWIEKCVARNEAPAKRVAIIGKALALVK